MKKFLAVIISIIIMLCTLSVSAEVPPHEISWNINDGILTISGQGAMEDYRNESDTPWYSQRESVTKIHIEDGITHIGNLAFYGMTNAKEAVIAESVNTVGLCAFSYTEGTVTTVSGLDSDYQFSVQSDSSVVSKGDSFTVSVVLEADFKDITALQTTLLYDKNRISINENEWYDKNWFDAVSNENLGYICKPLAGFVANNVRLAYFSASGTAIDDDCPLYDMGKSKQIVAKINCTAIQDIEDINSSCFAIKDSTVVIKDNNSSFSPQCGETQLTTSTRLPLPLLADITEEYNGNKGETVSSDVPVPIEIKVMADGKSVEYDVKPYVDENGILMLPIRHTLEAMGAIITWDNDTKTAFAHNKDKFFAVQIGQSLIFTDEGSKPLDAKTILKDTRTMVSADCISMVFDFVTQYNKETKTFTINFK